MKRILLWLLLLCCVGTAWATVPNAPYTVTYTCTGGFGPFPFTFPISTPTALTVTMNGTLLPSTDYTIVSVNNNYTNGGSVTLGGSFPCTIGWQIVLARATPVTQTIQFYDNMPIPMKTFERGLDKLTEIIQEVNGLIATLNGGGGTSYPGVTSCGFGCLQATTLQTNGGPPSGITVNTTPGYTGTITPGNPGCTIIVQGGIITGATSC